MEVSLVPVAAIRNGRWRVCLDEIDYLKLCIDEARMLGELKGIFGDAGFIETPEAEKSLANLNSHGAGLLALMVVPANGDNKGQIVAVSRVPIDTKDRAQSDLFLYEVIGRSATAEVCFEASALLEPYDLPDRRETGPQNSRDLFLRSLGL